MSRSVKVIFLDFDGVLNSDGFLLQARRKSVFEKDADEIDPSRVALLNQIVQCTGADVVVSSSWRIIMKLADIRGLLKNHGFVGNIVGATPNIGTPNRVRGDEIQRWIVECPTTVSNFVILDDDADMGALLPNLVQTSSLDGLTENDVERAIQILNR
jgi:hypothetical protein